MKSQRLFEFVVGIFIVLGALAFSFLAIRVSGLSQFNHHPAYKITAAFTDVGDLKPRAAVTIGGVTIGRVTTIILDPKAYRAVVTMEIEKTENKIPTDSTANIFTAGLIGANYISITPGFDSTYLQDGGEIQNTNQALILQNLIGQLMFELKSNKGKEQ